MNDPKDIPDSNLADSMLLRSSLTADGQSAVAQKGGIDVCWCCHDPVIVAGQYTDVRMGTAFVRICTKKECANSVIEEVRMSTDSKRIVSL